MKAELTKDEVESLLSEAEDSFPTSDFVASVREWFEDKGFITEAQEATLQKIADS